MPPSSDLEVDGLEVDGLELAAVESPPRRARRGRVGGRRAILAPRWTRGGGAWWWAVEGRFGGPVTVQRADGHAWTGDPAFDRFSRIQGDLAAARAGLSEPTRLLILRLLSLGVSSIRWSGGRLRIEAPRPWSGARATAAVAALRELCDRIESSTSVDASLMTVALEDPEVRVRAAAAETLLGRLRDRDPATVSRFCAALAASPRVRPRLRLDAIWTLEIFAPELAGAVLLPMVGVEALEIRCTVVERLGALGVKDAAEAIAGLAHHRHPRLAANATRALGALGDCAFEPLLLERLFAGPPEVRVASASALGRLGATTAVARALGRVAGERHEATELRHVARLALDQVKARLPPPGALAWPTAPDVGHLSMTLDVDEHPLPDEASPAEDERDRRGWLFDRSL